jgi:hypothetical protein
MLYHVIRINNSNLKYLSINLPFYVRKAFAKFRCSSNKSLLVFQKKNVIVSIVMLTLIYEVLKVNFMYTLNVIITDMNDANIY